jgi:hypothetical protein
MKNNKDNIYKLFEIDSINLAMNKTKEKIILTQNWARGIHS